MNDEIEFKRKNNRDRQRRFRARLRCIAENKPIPDEFALLTESRKPKSRKPKYDDRLTEDEKKEFQRKRQREYNWRFHGRLWFISQGKPIPDEFARWRKRRKPSYDDNAVKRKGEREKDDAALLMMEEHSTLLGHQSKVIQRMLANPIECKELAEASSRTVMNPQFQLDDDDPLHEVVYLSKQLKKIKREIRGKRKELEAVQACDDDEMALFRFNNDRSERLREWDSSLSWS